MNFRAPRRELARVDLTPLIDIIFQLVLFFMVSTSFIAAPGLDVELPRSNASTILRDQDDLSIWMSTDGQVFVNDEAVSWEGLVATLESAAKRDPRTLVIIKADTNVAHGRVFAVMELARSKGLTRLGMGGDPLGEKDDE